MELFVSWHWLFVFFRISQERPHCLLICTTAYYKQHHLQKCLIVSNDRAVCLETAFVSEEHAKYYSRRVVLWCMIYRSAEVRMLVWHHQNISNYTECSERLRGYQLTGVINDPTTVTRSLRGKHSQRVHHYLLYFAVSYWWWCWFNFSDGWVRWWKCILKSSWNEDMKFNMEQQITEVQSMYRSTATERYFQQMETRPIWDQST